ncbi:MAG: dual specificity protein phosphatase family protein [Spirochaetes bacterium]|nr:dual specificity protein phosphatase family protein [Spirochaetota bacterium]
MSAIWITQCLQNDFVRLLEPYEPLPNSLHVGYSEALRLLGEKPAEGPLGMALEWAYAEPAEKLALVHIRDWHNPESAAQSDHLQHFGQHCLAGSEGAEFVFKHQGQRAAVHIVQASGLNDFQDTNLHAVLESLGLRTAPGLHSSPNQDKTAPKIRVGLAGVWTEAKVYFLAYELLTRYANIDLCVCSALCASSSRHMHFTFLQQLKDILGVRIFASVADFTHYLTGSAPALATAANSRLDMTKLEFISPVNLDEDDKHLLLYLFRDSQSAAFKVLDGGFSGNAVLRASSRDHNGHQQVPVVVKLGKRDLIARERMSFEQIQEVMGNNAPSIVDFAESGQRGGIKYRYAAMKEGSVHCVQDLIEALLLDDSAGEQTFQDVQGILDQVFGQQLGKLYEAATLEKMPLFDYWEFSPRWADNVDLAVQAIAAGAAPGIFGTLDPLSLANFYRHELPGCSSLFQEAHYCSFVHGDLNGKNILIDSQSNVWIIDFFNCHRGHVIRDLVKFENDILFIFMKIADHNELAVAKQLVDQLLTWADLGRPMPAAGFDPGNKRIFAKTWRLLCHLRSMYARLVQSDRSPFQLHVAQLRYAVHTLSFDECSPLQKELALYTSLKLVKLILAEASRKRALQIDWFPPEQGGLIGLTILPGRKDWNRDLALDLSSMLQAGTSRVLCLVSPDEFIRYGVPELLQRYRQASLQILHEPIVDGGVPNSDQLQRIRDWLTDAEKQGEKTVIHCVGGLGRSGLIAAAWLRLRYGMSPAKAIDVVRRVRSPRAVETRAQEAFVAAVTAQEL